MMKARHDADQALEGQDAKFRAVGEKVAAAKVAELDKKGTAGQRRL